MEKVLKKRILVIEDENHIAEGVKLNLTMQGYDVQIAGDGSSGLQLWKEWKPDLIVLDIMLPVLDGISVLQSIRLDDEYVPILILSAKGTPEDRIKGLYHGVDDYISKPFNLEEFLLRVERLLTRVSRTPKNDLSFAEIRTYTFGENTIDFDTRTACCHCGTFHLTDQESKLLKIFIANRGKPISRQKLLEIGWGYSGDTMTRTLDNFIVRFRKYFEKNPRRPVFFKNLRSVGYIFSDEDTKK